ncbi:site-specific integrase [Myxococcus xanthus]|uniref:Site-specific integrase n=1 Tax=Myxococcus xanthus TaxID=34 RepID=A0A7Y4MV36_MYXXA|nr:site-specific integrase [Myxococcus xanthus]NOJ91161.1 site-specific integrase [Myxococcus xanthus]
MWVGKWAGGRIRDAAGRAVWVIERQWAGRRYSVALDAASEREALAELALWERDPDAYRTRRQAALDNAPVHIDEEAVAGLLLHLTEKGRGLAHRRAVRAYLSAWGEALAGRDLRKVQLRDLRKLLADWGTARKYRIIALKSFTAWLREEDRLKPSEDPTLSLRVPPAVAEKGSRIKGYSLAFVERIYGTVGSQCVRDVLCLRAKTGMHATEIARIAAGEGALRVVNDPCGIVGTVTFKHKNGRIHIVSLDAQSMAAAERLQARGKSPSTSSVHECLGYAAGRLSKQFPNERITPLVPGELRHSFATWASECGRVVKPTSDGVPLKMVAAVMGHLNTRTTKLFYEGVQIPPMIVLPLNLHHPKDPVLLDEPLRKSC